MRLRPHFFRPAHRPQRFSDVAASVQELIEQQWGKAQSCSQPLLRRALYYTEELRFD